MNSDIFGFVSSFKLASRKLRVSDSDFVDVFNHYFLPLTFCLFSLAICAKQYLIGDPLQCWVPKEYSDAWEQYAENYCWVENTYFVRSNQTLKKDQSSEIIYYQWVPFILILQGLMFYLPHYFWRLTNWMSGVDILHLMRLALDASTSSTNITKLVERFQDSFLESYGNKFVIKRKYFLCVCYIIMKILYLLNLILQFQIISSFLNLDFMTFGVRILNEFNNNIFWDKTGDFPRVTFCHFTIRTINENQNYTVQCVLVVNMLIEKLYITLWFILVFLLFLNLFNFANWMIWMVCKRKAVHDGVHTGIWDQMNSDSLFVLRLLKKNCLGLSYSSFITEFGKKTELYKDEMELECMI